MKSCYTTRLYSSKFYFLVCVKQSEILIICMCTCVHVAVEPFDVHCVDSLEVEVKTQLGFFLKLSFTKKFSNVLAVDVAILGESGADASVEIDTQFMVRTVCMYVLSVHAIV